MGWLVGRFVGDRNLNEKLLRKLENAPTLYLALSRFVRLVRSEASHIQLGILHRRDDILVYTHYADLRAESGYHFAQNYQLAVILEVLRHFLGRNWVPAEIGVESATAPIGLRDLFPGCRILSGQRVGYIAVPRSCLHIRASAPVPGRAGSLVMTDRFDYVDTIVALLKAYLADGYPSARDAASLMGTSERTLARALSSRGSPTARSSMSAFQRGRRAVAGNGCANRRHLALRWIRRPRSLRADVSPDRGSQPQGISRRS